MYLYNLSPQTIREYIEKVEKVFTPLVKNLKINVNFDEQHYGVKVVFHHNLLKNPIYVVEIIPLNMIDHENEYYYESVVRNVAFSMAKEMFMESE